MKYFFVIIILAGIALSGCEQGIYTEPETVVGVQVAQRECAPGLEGEYCELAKARIFIGDYQQIGGKCDHSAPQFTSHRITDYPADLTKITIFNGDLEKPLIADGRFEDWNFDIHPQMNVWTNPETGQTEEVEVSGLGWVDVGNNKLYYKLDHCNCRYELLYR